MSYSQNKADKVIDFIQHLKQSKGKFGGKPLVLMEWQKKFLSKLYGTVDKSGLRQYRSCSLWVGRKNGKSSLAAALALYHLFADGENGAQIVCIANSFQQASLIFDEATSMIRQSRALSSLCRINNATKKIHVDSTASSFQCLASDAGNLHGYNLSLAILDEVHAYKDGKVYEAISTCFAARTQPILITLSTAGSDTSSFAYELYTYAKNVQKGIIKDKTFLPVIYEAEQEDDWTNEQVWEKANPSLDITVSRDFLRQECKKALSMPAYQNSFRQLYLSQWVNQETRWINLLDLEACETDHLDDYKKGPCYVGVDLSTIIDLTAVFFFWPQTSALDGMCFMPADQLIRKEREDKAPYGTYKQQGYLLTTPGNAVDYGFIKKFIKDSQKKYEIDFVFYDPWNANTLMTELQHEGVPVAPVRQGFYSLSPACKHLEKLVISHDLKYKNPLLKWAFNNVTLSVDANLNVMPKKGMQTRRIDPVSASITGIAGYLLKSQAEETNVKKESTYNHKKLLVI